jgi:hypothetical protein
VFFIFFAGLCLTLRPPPLEVRWQGRRGMVLKLRLRAETDRRPPPPPVAAVTMPVAVVGGELLTVKFHQPSHEFTFGVGISFIPYPLVLTPLV